MPKHVYDLIPRLNPFKELTMSFTVPKFYLKSVMRSVDKHIDKAITKIINGEVCIPRKKKTKEKTYLKNKDNWHLIGERFYVTDDRVKCGKCIKVCPVQNISFREGSIVFADRCVACLGCYHRCPNKAIRYQNKKKDRYVNPNIDENLIGKNID